MVIIDTWDRRGVNGSVNVVVVLQPIHWPADHLDVDEDNDMCIEREIIIVGKV
jgi:hypothetical protein